MSELKSFIVLYDGKFIRAYKKSVVDKVIARHKYKRCLAMANICESNVIWVKGCSEWRRWKKWHKRWLELAEKFKDKEAK